MNDSSGINAIYTTGFNKLESLLDVKPNADDLWSEEEYAEIWQRQLQAPLEVDLRGDPAHGGAAFDVAVAAIDHPPRTFTDLFTMPDPSVDLLRVVKDHAKDLLDQADANQLTTLPAEMAGVLYLVSIAVALVRAKERIGARQDAVFLRMLDKALHLPWLDSSTRAVLKQAQVALSGG